MKERLWVDVYNATYCQRTITLNPAEALPLLVDSDVQCERIAQR